MNPLARSPVRHRRARRILVARRRARGALVARHRARGALAARRRARGALTAHRRARAVPRVRLLGLALLAAVGLLAGCGQAATILPPQRQASPVIRLAGGGPSHVAIIVMENEGYGDVIGNRSAPFINRLVTRAALATRMYAIAHPSLPNYLSLIGGSTFGIDSDCTGCRASGTSLPEQLQKAGITWRAYMEDLPHPCFQGAGNDGYAKKHDPFLYFPAIAGDPALCDRVVPLERLTADERDGSLPRLVWITPNLCHDMHDCDIATGDRFLAGLVPGLLARLGPRGLLILTWDEGSTDDGCCRLARGGRIVTILAGSAARAGARLSTPTDHFSVLQTVEDVFGVARLRGARCACTASLGPLLRGAYAVRSG